MKVSKITAHFETNVETVWNIVTDNEQFAWRTDLNKIEVVDDCHFIEFDKHDFQTSFMITKKEPYTFYAFTMENKNLTGRWQGTFAPSDHGTCVEFIEEISFRNPLLKVIGSFMNIRKIQERYIDDLKKEISKR